MERINNKSKGQIKKKSTKTEESEQGYVKVCLREVLSMEIWRPFL